MTYRTVTTERVSNGYIYTCIDEDGTIDVVVNETTGFPGIDKLLAGMVPPPSPPPPARPPAASAPPVMVGKKRAVEQDEV
jgi:hypothetical protein